jgi:hypothetical protein
VHYHMTSFSLAPGEMRAISIRQLRNAAIAGYSDIRITQRYVHPDADAFERAFAQMATRQKVVADGGYSKNAESELRKSRL